MKSISCNQMRLMDEYSIEKIGIPSIILMENAALKVLKHIDLDKNDSFTIVCGVGNNGGDGFALARHLFILDKKIDLFVLGRLDSLTEDARINLDILRNLGIGYYHISDDKKLEALKESVSTTDMTIDSIFGTGLTRDITGVFKDSIAIVNDNSRNTLSIDIPSGLNGDDGKTMGISVMANKTITFHRAKHGHLNNEEYTGELIVEDISIPSIATEAILNKEP